jgi:5'-nucleotidase
MNIILTNDDGIEATGIRELIKGLREIANLIVVAPAFEKSATSHSISLNTKLRVLEFEEDGINHYSVDGTPADCVKFAVAELSDFNPDLIISGINQGSNTGISVYYSGTVSAAREGFINGIPAVAISLCSRDFSDFRVSVNIAKRLVQAFAQGEFSKDTFLSVNVPPLKPDKIRGVKVAKQAHSKFVEEFVREQNLEKQKVYSLAGEIKLFNMDGSSDEEVIREGYIAITPLKLDSTDYEVMEIVGDWLKKQ